MFTNLIIKIKRIALLQIAIALLCFGIIIIYRKFKYRKYKYPDLIPKDIKRIDPSEFISILILCLIPIVGLLSIHDFFKNEKEKIQSSHSKYNRNILSMCKGFFTRNLNVEEKKRYKYTLEYHYHIILNPQKKFHTIIIDSFFELNSVIEKNNSILKYSEGEDLEYHKKTIKDSIIKYLDWINELKKEDNYPDPISSLENINSYKKYLEDLTESIKEKNIYN